MDIYRRRVRSATKSEGSNVGGFNPFKDGTKRLKAGYKRIGAGIIQEVATGRKKQF